MNYEDHPQVIDTILSIDELRDRLEYLNVTDQSTPKTRR